MTLLLSLTQFSGDNVGRKLNKVQPDSLTLHDKVTKKGECRWFTELKLGAVLSYSGFRKNRRLSRYFRHVLRRLKCHPLCNAKVPNAFPTAGREVSLAPSFFSFISPEQGDTSHRKTYPHLIRRGLLFRMFAHELVGFSARNQNHDGAELSTRERVALCEVVCRVLLCTDCGRLWSVLLLKCPEANFRVSQVPIKGDDLSSAQRPGVTTEASLIGSPRVMLSLATCIVYSRVLLPYLELCITMVLPRLVHTVTHGSSSFSHVKRYAAKRTPVVARLPSGRESEERLFAK